MVTASVCFQLMTAKTIAPQIDDDNDITIKSVIHIDSNHIRTKGEKKKKKRSYIWALEL